MLLWGNEEKIEEIPSSILDAKKICDQLGIKHHVLDLKSEFQECVINNFIEDYKKGLTPNPCIECNKYLKYGYFYQKARGIRV